MAWFTMFFICSANYLQKFQVYQFIIKFYPHGSNLQLLQLKSFKVYWFQNSSYDTVVVPYFCTIWEMNLWLPTNAHLGPEWEDLASSAILKVKVILHFQQGATLGYHTEPQLLIGIWHLPGIFLYAHITFGDFKR